MTDGRPLPRTAKVRLTLRIWLRFAAVRLTVRRTPLPDLVAGLGRPARPTDARYAPARLSRAVYRSLRLGRRRPTCLVSSLVLFRLLREQGDAAELVIGLPPASGDPIAHAWVELGGQDVGPPPGRGGHLPLARFG
jgi:Transglutaminase-like superfamily